MIVVATMHRTTAIATIEATSFVAIAIALVGLPSVVDVAEDIYDLIPFSFLKYHFYF